MKASETKGITLVEVLVTVALAALAIFTFVGAIFSTVTLNTNSKERLIALSDARRVAEAIRITADANGLTGSGSVTSPNGPWSQYLSNALASETAQVNTSGTDPLNVTVVVGWTEKNRNESLSLSTKVTNR